MPGGLLNLVSEGNLNVFLTGNPTKTFFKCVYKKYSNFGLQRLRIDYSGQRYLNIDQDSVFTFKIPRYAELLMDTFLVMNIPDIWSPVYNIIQSSGEAQKYYGVPYEFKWINNLGIEMIKEITISTGGQILQKMSGSYLNSLKERDYDINRKSLHDRMIGNTIDMYDPANAKGNLGRYPNAVNWEDETNRGSPVAEPSIRGRKLYIPIDAWFSLTSKMAFPLVSMQYNELQIKIQVRPVRELFTIRNVLDQDNNYPRIQPNFNNGEHGFYRFIQSPLNQVKSANAAFGEAEVYQDKNVEWNTDIHLLATYAFLTDEESKQFASHEQQYLFKEVHEYKFDNITGSKKLRLESMGMVANWMFYFQRNDIFERNQWSNFTNWDYDKKPYQITKYHPDHIFYDPDNNYGLFSYPTKHYNRMTNIDPNTSIKKLYLEYDENYQPNFGRNLKTDNASNPDMFEERLYNTGPLKIENNKDILIDMAILFDGQYREENLDAGIFNYVEKYNRTNGNAKDGLYCYNFCLSTNPFDTQPSGAINMSKFEKIELEINTVEPPKDPGSQFTVICDDDGDEIGVRQPSWDIYKYNYNLTIFEERYNILHFMAGNCALKFSR